MFPAHSNPMTANLPDGHTWRRATPADAELIFGLISRYNGEVLGYADYTLDELRDDLVEPGFDVATDSWLGFTPDGELAGFAWVIGKGTGQEAEIEVITRDAELARWLYAQVLARAAELARAAGHPSCAVNQGIYRDDTRARAAAAEQGLRPETVFHRMRVDHGPDTPNPAAPLGLTVHTGPGDEDFLRTAHAVLNESFKDHFGWFPRPFDEWRQQLDQESTFSWPQLAVAALDSRPAAIIMTSDRFVEDENCGYVSDLGVLPEARGRGIAKYLLRTAFAADARAGRTGTILHVDTNNVTPALGLYESVGMRPVLIIDMWRRDHPTGA